jgi:predicted dienelactone hydrolase
MPTSLPAVPPGPDRRTGKRPRWIARWLLAVSLALPAWANAGVGIAAIEVADPVGGGTMPGYVFYPSASPTQRTTIGPYEVAAAFDAPTRPGARPLVVVSHGHGGSSLGHHDLATYLAGHGFVVATFEHPKDNFRDQSGNGRAEVMAGRAVQVAATITALLDAPRWKPLIDPGRIGVAGFSSGGYTSLRVVGAVPRFDRFIGYCDRHPKDVEICGLVRELGADATRETLAALQKEFTRYGDTADPRVKAAFAMAPQSIVFDKAGLARVERPVFLYYGEHDRVLLPSENALRIQPLVPGLDGIAMVPKADHWVFLAPCSEALAREVGELCRDPAGVDRAQVHARVNADALAFFRKTLGVAAD